LCKGAAAILNRKPITINNKPIIEIVTFSPVVPSPPWRGERSNENTKLNIDSKLVKPVKAYIKALPNRIKQEDNPPNKKYFNPALVEPSLSRCNVAKIYTAKDCNSILKYIEIKSALEIRREAPNTLNRIIKGYSERIGPLINVLLDCL
jgi:hypothetical protein